MSTTEKLLEDLKHRFLTFETIRGIYLLPAGLLLIWITWSNLFQYILHAAATVAGGYLVVDGLRKIFVNRVKQQAVIQQAVDARMDSHGGA